MKIFLVSNTAWSIFNFRSGLITSLIGSGHEVVVVAPEDNFSSKLSAMGCKVISMVMSAKGVNPVEDMLLVMRLARLYKKMRPDFVIHYTIKPNIYGSLAARLACVPCIAVTTGLGYTFMKNNWLAYVSRCLYKVAFLSPKEVWFLNKDDLHTFLTQRLVASEKTVLLHGEGVNTSHFTPQPKPLNDGKTRFLLVARMLWDKGIGDFVEAARQLRAAEPNVIFQLLGDCGVLNPSAIDRTQIAAWEDEGVIEYLGSTTDVRSYIAQVDCVVLPSYREGIPRTLLEAAAMGKPLIATNAAGCRDVVSHGKTGWLCPVKDPTALAGCMKLLLARSPSEREAMGQAGRRLVERHFNEQTVVDHYAATLARYGLLTRKTLSPIHVEMMEL